MRRGRGVLDTNTVILLRRLTDPTVLPAEPLITAITLAELSVGPLIASTDAERAGARPTFSKRRPTSSRCRSMRRPHGCSVAWPHRCVERVGRSTLARTTR
jgi:hypothetical protein